MVTINIGRKESVVFVGMFVLLLGVGLGVAYNSGAAPSVMGHSADEIEGGAGGSGALGDRTNLDSSGNPIVVNTIYQAEVDGFITAWGNGNSVSITLLSDSSNPPTTAIDYQRGNANDGNFRHNVQGFIREGDYVRVTDVAVTVNWISFGSGDLVRQ